MQKIYILFLLLAGASFRLSAQADCAGGRYSTAVFSNYDLISDTTYGQNTSVNGASTVLKMDIYQPQGDTLSARPLIVMAHGGTFISGDKAGADIVPLAQDFVKKGYVCASINYRLGIRNFPLPGPDSTDATEAVYRAVQDAKAAVRFFYKDRATVNSFRIDTNRVYFLGSSAGGFMALHYAYLDQLSEIPSALDTTVAGMGGGVEGNSGNPGYSSRIAGIINLAGAIGDTAWIQPGDEPCVSLHGTNDQVVPYGSQMLYLSGIFPILEVDGSGSIHPRLDAMGVTNCLYTEYGADHVAYVGNQAYTDTTINVITQFMTGLVCNSTPVCVQPIVSNDHGRFSQALQLWPNPSHSGFNLMLPEEVSEGWTLSIYDLNGRILSQKTGTGTGKIRLGDELPRGMYLMNLNGGGKTETLRIVVE